MCLEITDKFLSYAKYKLCTKNQRHDYVYLSWKKLQKIGKILHFLNDAFQLYYDPFQVNWLVQK